MILLPLEKLYSAITKARNALYDARFFKSYSSSLPVVSVGNITVGGNGKTPLTMAIAELLCREGKHPVILTRGYGGKVRGPCLVTEEHAVSEVGDEALLMKRRLDIPVVIAKKRAEGARLIEEKKLGDCILLDDGLQHRALGRDLNIIALDVSHEAACKRFLDGHLLPRGVLREERKGALGRADAFVLVTREIEQRNFLAKEQLKIVLPQSTPTFETSLHAPELIAWKSGERVSLEELRSHTLISFSGLAYDQGFVNTLSSLDIPIHSHKSFPDHHQFKDKELDSLLLKARGGYIICTEKDAMRIPSRYWDTLLVLRISFKLDAAFSAWLMASFIHQPQEASL